MCLIVLVMILHQSIKQEEDEEGEIQQTPSKLLYSDMTRAPHYCNLMRQRGYSLVFTPYIHLLPSEEHTRKKGRENKERQRKRERDG